MKIKSLILLTVSLFLLFSCDSGMKFENPYDKNNEAGLTDDDTAQTDTESEQADDADSHSGRKQGELYGDCFPDQTCDAGLICDIENNVCIRDYNDSEKDDSNTTSEQTDDFVDTASEQTDDEADTADSQTDEDPGTQPAPGATRTFNCFGLPENAAWNSVSKIK